MKGIRGKNGHEQDRLHKQNQSDLHDADSNDSLEMLQAAGAEVTAVEAHPKQPGMYRVWLRITRGSEADWSTEGRSPAQTQSQPSEDWHEEVDSWLKDAASAADRLAEDYSVTVHEDTLVSMRLLKGRKLTVDEWQQLRQEEALEDAYRAALAIIERKARTSRELADNLKRKGYAAEAIEGCLQRLRSRRLLDDSAYAKRFAEQRTSNQRKGSRLIRQELVQRGIPKDEANRVIGELDERLEIEAATALARKKWPQTKGELRDRRMKLTGFLLRRGFPNGIVRTALEQVLTESAQEDEADHRLRPDEDEHGWQIPDWDNSE